jgi:hypothetical protein
MSQVGFPSAHISGLDYQSKARVTAREIIRKMTASIKKAAARISWLWLEVLL